MILTETKRYLRIYRKLFKFSLISATIYHINFLVGLLVEVGYALVLIVFFKVIYSNVTTVVGWTYYEMLFLLGLNIISSELLLGLTYIFNFKDLARRIKDGDLDFMLLKPLNCFFQASLARPYFISFIATIPGIYLMYYALSNLNYDISFLNILSGGIIFIAGFFIGYAILTIFHSLSFVMINATTVTNLGQQIIVRYKQNPHQVYGGPLRIIFFYIFPIVFMSSMPAYAILHGVDYLTVIKSVGIAMVFFTFALFFWHKMIKYYTSASS